MTDPARTMHQLFQEATTTEGITVRVSAAYLPDQSSSDASRWFWSYHIRIENGSSHTVQLLTRHWRITDGRGMVNIVEGDGVVGEQPVLAPGRSHDYVSGCPLATPGGRMTGHYGMVDELGRRFFVAIPEFHLTLSTAPA